MDFLTVRAMDIGRMAEVEMDSLHRIERKAGRCLAPFEIQDNLRLDSLKQAYGLPWGRFSGSVENQRLLTLFGDKVRQSVLHDVLMASELNEAQCPNCKRKEIYFEGETIWSGCSCKNQSMEYIPPPDDPLAKQNWELRMADTVRLRLSSTADVNIVHVFDRTLFKLRDFCEFRKGATTPTEAGDDKEAAKEKRGYGSGYDSSD